MIEIKSMADEACNCIRYIVLSLLFHLVQVVCDFTGLCVRRRLNDSLDEFSPDLIVYIAGTAVLSTDESGGLCLSPQVCSVPTAAFSLGLKPLAV